MQPDPGAVGLRDLAERAHQIEQAGLDRLAIPEAGAVLHVHTVGRGVLAHHQQLLDAGLEELAGFAEHITNGAAHKITAHARDDAEGAAVVAALADLQIRIVARRELDALRRHQVHEGIVRLGQVGVHRLHHLMGGVGTGHRQHAGVHLAHQIATALAFAGTQAAGDDDLAVRGQGLTDGVQTFAHRIVDEAAGVDDHQIGTGKGLGSLITLGAELREDEFGIGQGLGATQADEADLGRGRGRARCLGDITHGPDCLRPK